MEPQRGAYLTRCVKWDPLEPHKETLRKWKRLSKTHPCLQVHVKPFRNVQIFLIICVHFLLLWTIFLQLLWMLTVFFDIVLPRLPSFPTSLQLFLRFARLQGTHLTRHIKRDPLGERGWEGGGPPQNTKSSGKASTSSEHTRRLN